MKQYIDKLLLLWILSSMIVIPFTLYSPFTLNVEPVLSNVIGQKVVETTCIHTTTCGNNLVCTLEYTCWDYYALIQYEPCLENKCPYTGTVEDELYLYVSGDNSTILPHTLMVYYDPCMFFIPKTCKDHTEPVYVSPPMDPHPPDFLSWMCNNIYLTLWIVGLVIIVCIYGYLIWSSTRDNPPPYTP